MKCTRNRGDTGDSHTHTFLCNSPLDGYYSQCRGDAWYQNHDQVALCKTLEGLNKKYGSSGSENGIMFIGIANCGICSCQTFPTSLMSIYVLNQAHMSVTGFIWLNQITKQFNFSYFPGNYCHLKVARHIRVSLRLIMLCSRRWRGCKSDYEKRSPLNTFPGVKIVVK